MRDHGEVFTPEWLVNAMCDLVADECLRPDARFLEPACGDGNFLAVILSRKLAALTARHRRHRADYEAYSFVSVASLYGVDVLADNVVKCRERLLALWQGAYPFSKQTPLYPRLEGAIRAVLDRNILCGDALTLKRADGSPLCFTECACGGSADDAGLHLGGLACHRCARRPGGGSLWGRVGDAQHRHAL